MDLEEKLIYLVRKYECLYNVNAKNYSDRHSKNKAWAKVTEEMNLSLYECQKKWKKLRDCYRKAIKLRQTSGSARINRKPIKFEQELEFLKPYVINQLQTSNLDSSETEENLTDTESIQNVNVPSPQVWPASNSSQNEQTSQVFYREAKLEDPTDSFFLTMSQKVKNMPKKIQLQIERDIFRIVNEAEIKLANDNLPSKSEILD